MIAILSSKILSVISSMILLCFLTIVCSEKLVDMSFEPPFKDVDHAGDRLVSRQWRVSGAAAVQENFVRITPDRQSKKGAIWSRKNLGVQSASAILKFRISGQGRQFFGDGLALWIVTQGYYMEGDLHGFQDSFVGVGIIFDTYKNSDNLQLHRDVTVLVNDGLKKYEDMITEAAIEGCNINVRYHAERADFNVKNSLSLAKFVVTDRSIDLFVDARNTGEWTRCVKLDNLTLPEGWLTHAHIGVSASTGQLADNHDVISLQTYSEAYVMEQEIANARARKHYSVAPDATVEDRILSLEVAMDKLTGAHEFLDHHTEHELVTVEDQLANIKAKIEHVGPTDHVVADIVRKESGNLVALSHDLSLRMQKLEQALSIMKKGSSGGEWKWPFFFLTVLVLGAIGGGIFFYLHLAKKWKLP